MGYRTGCSVTSVVNNTKYVGYVGAVDTSSNTVIANMYNVAQIGNNAPTPQSWTTGQTYNIYVPLRTGMNMRVDNKLALTVGDHIITSINYNWTNGHVSSEITTVGINDEAIFKSAREILSDPSAYLADAVGEAKMKDEWLASGAYQARGILWWHDHAYMATPNLAAAALRDYNSFSWSGGMIIVNHNNEKFQINPGNTDAALTYSGYTSPMQPNMQYVLYLDRKDPQQYNTYDIRIAQVTHDDDCYMRANHYLEMAYMTIGKNEDAGTKPIGIPGCQ